MLCLVFWHWVLLGCLTASCWPHQFFGLHLRLNSYRFPGRADGLGTEACGEEKQSDGRWWAMGVDLGDRPFTSAAGAPVIGVVQRAVGTGPDLQRIVKARMGERVPTPTIGSMATLAVSFSGLTAMCDQWSRIFVVPVA